MNLICPYCHKRLYLTSRDVLSEAASISAGRRKKHGGPVPVMRKCPKCGKQHSAREMRKCKAPSR